MSGMGQLAGLFSFSRDVKGRTGWTVLGIKYHETVVEIKIIQLHSLAKTLSSFLNR